MNQIIDKLSEIETASSRILDAASNQKKQLAIQAENQIASYDKELEASTEKELDILQDTLSKQLEKELFELRKSADSILESMEHYYEENHNTLSAQIYKKIIRK